MNSELSKIDTLDGLRGYAALLVLIARFPPITNSSLGFAFRDLTETLQLGYVGVDIFFALSGFLITRILIFEKTNKIISFKRFYLKRSLRIFPIYYLTIILVGLVISWDKLGYVAGYISNYYFSFHPQSHPLKHTWSLCVEEHFYLIWPFILYSLPLKLSRHVVLFAIPLIAIIGGIITFQLVGDGLAYNLLTHGTLYRILTLSLGSAVAFYEVRFSSIKPWVIGILVGTLPILALSGKLISNPVFTMVCISTMSLIILIVSLRLNNFWKDFQTVKHLLTNSIIKFFGKISYGLYLYHYPILYFFGFKTTVKFATPVMAIVSLSLCLGVPILSFYLIESPLLRLKTRLQ